MDKTKSGLNKVVSFYLSLLTTLFIITACGSSVPIFGKWQDTNNGGSIEFKENGEVIIIDNMSATVTGTFNIKGHKLITFELTATDVMQDSIQPIEKQIVTAKIIKFNDDELHLTFSGETDIEHYKRLH